MSVHIFVPNENVAYDSSIMRVRTMRRIWDHIPAWRVQSRTKGVFYICGRCFASRGNGPATNAEEMWTAGAINGQVVPQRAICHQCGGRAWPTD